MINKIILCIFFIFVHLQSKKECLINNKPDSLVANKYFIKAYKFAIDINCDSAIKYFQKAEIIYNRNGNFQKYIESKNYRLKQLILQEKSYDILKLSDSIKNEIEKKHFNNNYIADIYFNIGLSNYLIWNHNNAKFYFLKALEIYYKKLRRIDATFLDINIHLGRSYDYLNLPDYGLKILNKSVKNSKNLNDTLIDDIYNALCWHYIQKASYSKNIKLLDSSIYYNNLAYKIRTKKATNKYYNLKLAQTYNGYACINDMKKNEIKSLNYHKQAYNIRKLYWKHHPDLTLSLSGIGTKYYLLKNYDSAIYYYKKAILSGDIGYQTISSNYLPNFKNILLKNEIFGAIGWLKIIFYHRYFSNQKNAGNIKDLREIETLHQYTLDLIDFSKNDNNDEISKMGWSNYFTDNFTTNVVNYSLIRLNNITKDIKYLYKLFYYKEKNNLGIINNTILKSAPYNSHYNIPKEIISKERKLKNQLSVIYNLYKESMLSNNYKNITKYETELNKINIQLKHVLEIYETKYPQFYSLKYDNEVIDVKSVQKKLKPAEALVEYTKTDTVLFIYLIKKNDYKVYKQKLEGEFDYNIGKYRNNLCMKQSNINEFINSSTYLYYKLIKPFENDLNKVKSLIIIPDRNLNLIPFECLISDRANVVSVCTNNNYKNLPYLIKKYSISYANSATLYFKQMEIKKSKVKENLLGFAPNYDSYNEYQKLIDKLVKERSVELVALPGIRKEVQNITKYISGKILMDEDASESKLKALFTDYRIIHIASHGIVDNENPSKSCMVLSKDNQNDGYLYLYELLNLQSNAELAVLSACNTGNGKLLSGEGVISLARGFFYTGIPSVVMSLWNLNDESSSVLMGSFYKYLKQGLSKDEALQRAKLDYLQSSDALTSNPYFWAGFVCIGNNGHLELNDGFDYKMLWWSLVPIFGFAFYFTQRTLRIKRKGTQRILSTKKALRINKSLI